MTIVTGVFFKHLRCHTPVNRIRRTHFIGRTHLDSPPQRNRSKVWNNKIDHTKQPGLLLLLLLLLGKGMSPNSIIRTCTARVQQHDDSRTCQHLPTTCKKTRTPHVTRAIEASHTDKPAKMSDFSRTFSITQLRCLLFLAKCCCTFLPV